jgi:hypothetical protein
LGNVQLPKNAIIGAFAGNLGKRTVAKERDNLNFVSYTKLFKGLQQELNPLQLRPSAHPRVSDFAWGTGSCPAVIRLFAERILVVFSVLT